MKYKRIGRMMLCLLLVCVLLVNVSPIRAEASAAGLLGSIAGVTSVNVPAGLVFGGLAIALGVMAGTNDDFVDMVDYAVDSATDWVKDGTVELLRVVDATGKAAYYAAGDMLEDLRKSFFDNGVLSATTFVPVTSVTVNFPNGANGYKVTSSSEFNLVHLAYTYPSGDISYPYLYVGTVYGFSNVQNAGLKRTWLSNGNSNTIYSIYREGHYIWQGFYGGISTGVKGPTDFADPLPNGIPSVHLGCFDSYEAGLSACYAFDPLSYSGIETEYDLTLGKISSVPIDGSSALDWSEEYASKRIYVTGGSNDPEPPDENNGKWFWPIALPLTVATLLAMSQADEWSGETPQEFDQYTQNTEFEILNRPEFDGYQAIEIAPVTNPNPNPNPDVGENPEVNTDYRTWFSKLYTVVENIQGKLEEIPNRFQSWITDCKTAIEELPSKFESWITDCKTAIEELPSKFGSWLDKILEWLQKVWEGIISIPESLLNGIKALFIPSEDFLTSKVEAIRAEYAFADSIIATGEYIGASLTGLETSPPVIYIHLEDTEGSYDIGGTVPFIDMRWYERYKPTVDALLSALLWIIFAWRVFLKLPGIISGMPGDFVMDGLNQLGAADHLPSRKAGYEVQRMANREQIRRGNK